MIAYLFDPEDESLMAVCEAPPAPDEESVAVTITVATDPLEVMVDSVV